MQESRENMGNYTHALKILKTLTDSQVVYKEKKIHRKQIK